MSGYAVLALLGVTAAGVSDEVSCEAATLDDVFARVRELAAAHPGFRAVTIVHIEDLPPMLAGATTPLADPA